MVVENEAQLAKFVGLASTLESVKAIVVYRGGVPEGTDCGFPVYTWGQFMEVSLLRPSCNVWRKISSGNKFRPCTCLLLAFEAPGFVGGRLCQRYQLEQSRPAD